jgi:hypothetical protein
MSLKIPSCHGKDEAIVFLHASDCVPVISPGPWLLAFPSSRWRVPGSILQSDHVRSPVIHLRCVGSLITIKRREEAKEKKKKSIAEPFRWRSRSQRPQSKYTHCIILTAGVNLYLYLKAHVCMCIYSRHLFPHMPLNTYIHTYIHIIARRERSLMLRHMWSELGMCVYIPCLFVPLGSLTHDHIMVL